MKPLTLHELMSVIADKQGNKPFFYNNKPIGGMGSAWFVAMLVSLPIMEFILVFNPITISYVGIASAVVMYIIIATMIMMLIAFLTWNYNRVIIRNIHASWNYYFPDVDLDLVLTPRVSPYNNFYHRYKMILAECLEAEEELYKAMKDALLAMENENKELIEKMRQG